MQKIGVVLAIYNGEKYLTEFLESLKFQTRKPDFIFAIDDASADNSVSILETFKKDLPIEIFQSKKNQGHLKTFCKGLEIAAEKLDKNDFIALADQDDIWLENKLEILEKEFAENQTDVVFGDAEVIDGKGNLICSSWRKFSNIQTEISVKHEIAGINQLSGCMSLFKVSFLEKVLPIPESILVHDRWISAVALKNKGLKAISEPVILYRIHSANAIGINKVSLSETLKNQILLAKAFLENKERLCLNASEISFAKKLVKLSEARRSRLFVFETLPWIFKERRFLFLKENAFRTFLKVLFSAVGLPLAKKIFHKN